MIKEFMSVKKLPKNPSLLLIESKGFKWLIVVNVETRENRRDGADSAVALEESHEVPYP